MRHVRTLDYFRHLSQVRKPLDTTGQLELVRTEEAKTLLSHQPGQIQRTRIDATVNRPAVRAWIVASLPSTISHKQLRRMLMRLRDHKTTWSKVALPRKFAVRDQLRAHSEHWTFRRKRIQKLFNPQINSISNVPTAVLNSRSFTCMRPPAHGAHHDTATDRQVSFDL